MASPLFDFGVALARQQAATVVAPAPKGYAVNAKITPAMVREMRAIRSTGAPGDLDDYGRSALAFHAREKVLTALLRRDLIAPDDSGYSITERGRYALSMVQS